LLARRFAARYSSAAPPPAVLPKKSARPDNFLSRICLKEKRKNFKELLYNLNGATDGISKNCVLLPDCAIKKRNSTNADTCYRYTKI